MYSKHNPERKLICLALEDEKEVVPKTPGFQSWGGGGGVFNEIGRDGGAASLGGQGMQIKSS